MVPEYGRYWHGYLVFLRPILMFFPYEEIKYEGVDKLMTSRHLCAIRLHERKTAMP